MVKQKSIWLTLTLTSLILYFIYHSLSGERGIISLVKLRNTYSTLQEKLEKIRGERLNIEHKVNLLRSKSLDLDLLEERAKKILSYSKDNEIIYYYEDNSDNKDNLGK